MSTVDLVRYQDPLDGLKNGLQLAIENERFEATYIYQAPSENKTI